VQQDRVIQKDPVLADKLRPRRSIASSAAEEKFQAHMAPLTVLAPL
jgi:hypothetical protein